LADGAANPSSGRFDDRFGDEPNVTFVNGVQEPGGDDNLQNDSVHVPWAGGEEARYQQDTGYGRRRHEPRVPAITRSYSRCGLPTPGEGWTAWHGAANRSAVDASPARHMAVGSVADGIGWAGNDTLVGRPGGRDATGPLPARRQQ